MDVTLLSGMQRQAEIAAKECIQRALLSPQAVAEQPVDLLAHLFTWWYPSPTHGVWCCLPLRAGDLTVTAVYHTPSDFARSYCHHQNLFSHVGGFHDRRHPPHPMTTSAWKGISASVVSSSSAWLPDHSGGSPEKWGKKMNADKKDKE